MSEPVKTATELIIALTRLVGEFGDLPVSVEDNPVGAHAYLSESDDEQYIAIDAPNHSQGRRR